MQQDLKQLTEEVEKSLEPQFKELDKICTGLRAMLVASINTAKGNVK